MARTATAYRLTVEQYLRMGETGIIPPDARTELLDGEIVEMTPIGSPHAAVTSRLVTVFAPLLPRVLIRVQCPVRLGSRHLPQPDLVLARPRSDEYAASHPGPRDVLLLVEVADTSLHHDRETKGPLYSRHGIGEYWILNLVDRQLEVHRGADRVVLGPEAELAPVAFPDFAVAVAGILP